MFVVRNYVTTFGTLACALGIGYFMQNGSSAQPDGAQGSVTVASNTGQASVLAGLDSIELTSSSPTESLPNDTLSPPSPARLSPAWPKSGAECTLSARAYPVAGASARLNISAPCHGGERVEIRHSGLTLTQKTNDMGFLDLTIPALSEYAIFLISFEDQTGTVATTHISDIDRFNRIALQWRGGSSMQIHALEFGAFYGQPGHVWADPAAQGAGNVVHLGGSGYGDAQNVEIYSFPADQSDQSGTISLSVEAEVTEANCGRELSVQSLELRSDNRLRSRDLTLAMPDCSQAGEFLVLNNLLSDLTIAAK